MFEDSRILNNKVFKTAIAVEIITHTFDFAMAVFDVANHVISSAGGVIAASTAIDSSALSSLQSTLEAMNIFELFGLYFQVSIIFITRTSSFWQLTTITFI